MRIVVFLLSYFVTITVHAQIDPSSALLLKQGNRPATREGGLDSGRYTVRPGSKGPLAPSPRPLREEARRVQQSESDDQRRPIATEPGNEEQKVSEAPMRFPEPMVIPETLDQGAGETKPTYVANPTPGTFLAGAQGPVEEQSISEAMLGGSDEEIENYRELLNPEDRRRNLVELSLAPAYIYNASKSPYLFRDYTTAGPGVSAEAKIWFSPFFGIQASYMTTLSGSVSDSFTDPEYIPTTQSWLRGGIRSRSFLATGRYSPSLTFGLDYYEYQFRVPSDADNRGRLRTTGAALSLDGEWPTSERFSWLMGFSFVPKASHKESATDFNLHSGSKPDSNGLGISLGGRIQYDRKSAMFIRITHSLEKHVFSGQASEPDPRTGVAPSGVPVTNSFTILQLGYTWGS